MFWKPFSITICHATKIPYVLYLMTVGVTRLPGCLLYMVLQWSRFLTLQLALRVLPTGVILAIFWLIAPLHTNYWNTVRRKNVPKCGIDNFSLHRDTMVLTNVIHLAQGCFKMVYRGVCNPILLYRTMEFAHWYFEQALPGSAKFSTQFFVFGLSLFGVPTS